MIGPVQLLKALRSALDRRRQLAQDYDQHAHDLAPGHVPRYLDQRSQAHAREAIRQRYHYDRGQLVADHAAARATLDHTYQLRLIELHDTYTRDLMRA